MRYAIISDLHANLQATEAVLADLSAQQADRVICLGDAIGYGPQPAEVLSLVHAHVQEMLMGNHEAAAAGLMNTDDFSRGARASLASTRRKLNRAALDYIASLPYEIESPAFRCSHSDFVDPRAFGYVETAEDAARSFAACEEPLLFVGHTHEPAVFALLPDGTCIQQPAADFTLELGHRYLVNPGSVGMPRTKDPRATYCIYDTQDNRLSFHRTSYGVREFRRLVEADAKDSEQLAYVLDLLDSHALPVLHARTDFAAPRKPAAPPPARRVARTTRPRTTTPQALTPCPPAAPLPRTADPRRPRPARIGRRGGLVDGRRPLPQRGGRSGARADRVRRRGGRRRRPRGARRSRGRGSHHAHLPLARRDGDPERFPGPRHAHLPGHPHPPRHQHGMATGRMGGAAREEGPSSNCASKRAAS
jgi:predicted phosphodiesterase